jgi:hypothetical protein
MSSDNLDLAPGGRYQALRHFFGVLSLRYPPTIATLSLVVIPVVEGGPQMKRSYSARVKSFLIFRRKRKRQAVEIAEAACLLEKTLAKVPLNGEPELPKHYRHIRSAIGALLILGRDCEF